MESVTNPSPDNILYAKTSNPHKIIYVTTRVQCYTHIILTLRYTVDWGELAQRGELANYSKFYINYFHFHYYSTSFKHIQKQIYFLMNHVFEIGLSFKINGILFP